MVNVSLDVGLNNTVSPQDRQVEESSDGKGFMAMLAEANEREDAKAAIQKEADKEELTNQETSAEKTRASEVQQGTQRPVPKGLDEPLKLDDSNLPKPNQGPDVVLKVETTNEASKPSSTPNPDTLLSQINAANNQKTDVEHHLAPVPQALKDHLGKAEKVDELPVKGGKKGPIDLIGPIVVQDNKLDNKTADATPNDSVKAESKQANVEVGNSSKQLPGQGEVVKPVPAGPRYSEGPIGDPTDGEAQVSDKPKMLESGNRSIPDVKAEAFNGVAKEREWHLHNEKESKPASVASQKPNTDVDSKLVTPKASESEQKAPDLISQLMQKERTSAAPQQDNSAAPQQDNKMAQPSVSEAVVKSPLNKNIEMATDKPTEPAAVSDSDGAEIVKNIPKQAISEFVNVPKAPESKSTSVSELKAMVDNLSPQEKQELETLLNERLNDTKSKDSASRKQEAALYQALTGKSPNSIAQEGSIIAGKVTGETEQKDNALINGIKQSSDKLESVVKSEAPVKPEFTYNSTKAPVKEQVAPEASKQSVADVVVNTEEQTELPSDFEGEQQNSGNNQRQTASQNVENVFKAIRSLGSEQIQSKEEFEQVIQQVEQSRQNQQTAVQQTSAQVKLQADPALAQALNLTRNDAAKMLQEKVNMMINLNNKEAEIRLDPAELGSMQIRIRSDAEQAQINFVVQNQQAKELLEESMPKLREMLEEQGIELGESNIQQQSEGNSNGDDGEQQGHGKLANEASEAQNNKEQSVTSRKQSDSAIDYYA
ncbi:flagellar hook-length control protein FliK [Pseudoalteromonas luteoviolacea]|uniref:flagellar hook-length control protein FliK n=1 Tax=Pseudoalteromonas luteoviolacea TaxID=43657 RepID=UPI001B37B466|nr:flagellar hook-length control protein FliK [Pseudoalteromonas luteoviolacea]MBQ4810434.1 flagellar hook-length control protein FliK [Pseudoalteromonas luteoviolacea]